MVSAKADGEKQKTNLYEKARRLTETDSGEHFFVCSYMVLTVELRMNGVMHEIPI